ncbi:MAG: hypothetical protein HPAVJP_1620 [Candidatus Hepatoplasma vulgare]|nr:MAG: hypothetical protein HPAVJP_1620 [Candidatus Hepatoplasma sp.]
MNKKEKKTIDKNLKNNSNFKISEKENDSKDRMNDHDLDSFPTYLWKLILGIIILVFVFISSFAKNPEGDFLKFITNDWFTFFLATIVMIIYGIDYFRVSFIALIHGKVSENLLVSFSMIASYTFSFVTIIVWPDSKVMFEATSEVAIIIYFGNYLEEYLSKKITKDLNNTLELYSKEAIILIDGEEKKIAPSEIRPNDIMVVYPGEKIPTDGIIFSGITEIDESTFTGESLYITKKKGNFVYGSTISKTKILVKATKEIKNSILSQIIDKIEETKNAKPDTQKIADKIAQYLIPIVLIVSLITFMFYLIFANDVYESFQVWVTVLVVACPCSFAMLTPLSILVANSESAKKHIILNSKEVFEKITTIDSILFDKTGTLTKGKISVIDYKLDQDIIPILVSAERNFNHPISKAIVKYFSNYKEIKNDIKYDQILGKGILIKYKEKKYYIGSNNFAKEKINYEEEDFFKKIKNEGKRIIYFFDDKKILGHIVLADKVKEEAKDVIKKLNDKNIEVFMVTGDSKRNSEFIAKELGIKLSNIYAEVLPIDKSKIVKKMQDEGKKVAFVGDGINDSIALEQADLGISMGSANDIAIQSSDITIQNNNLHNVYLAIKFSRTTVFTIYFGFFIAILYNAIFIPLAMAAVLTPLIGAIAMMLNDTMALFVALSLKRLKFKK